MWTELGVQVLRGGSPGIPVFLPHQNQLTADYILLWCYAPISNMGHTAATRPDVECQIGSENPRFEDLGN